MKSSNWKNNISKALLIFAILVAFAVADEAAADMQVWREGSKIIHQYDSTIRSALGHSEPDVKAYKHRRKQLKKKISQRHAKMQEALKPTVVETVP